MFLFIEGLSYSLAHNGRRLAVVGDFTNVPAGVNTGKSDRIFYGHMPRITANRLLAVRAFHKII
jgi:hypothetical protein